MSELLENIKKNLNDFMSKYSKKQRIGLAVGVILLLVITTGSIIYMTRPEYVVLYKDLNLEESGKAIGSLDELGISYKLENEGTTILVKKEEASKTRINLSMKGLPTSKFDYEDYRNSSSMFMSKEEKENMYKMALENVLTGDVEAMAGIKEARVRLTIPKEDPFILSDDIKVSKASVWVSFDEEILSEDKKVKNEMVKGIASYIANATERLEESNVKVFNENGILLTSLEDESDAFMSSNQLDLQNEVKDKLQDNLVKFLGPVYGYENISVMATVKLNFDTNYTESKIYDTPIEGEENGLIRSSDETATKNSTNANGGIPGTDTNTEEIQQYLEEDSSNSVSASQRKIVNYELNETFKKLEKAKGQIEDISVAVIVNRDSLEGQELSDDQKSQIKKIVATASGFNTSVEVYAQTFNSVSLDEVQTTTIKEGLPLWIWIVIGVLFVLPLVLFGIYMFLNRKKEEEEELEIEEEELEDLELEMKESGYKKSIENLIEKNPEITSQLLKSWLDEE
ncbi:MAG: flagellar basal-body MS-ring/collar protein FliF [Peptostreptococcaceae bacterium]|jgi:flagellar M-ring protein FliF|nr:flagellar basal-body MS-ring/collar protein FliF [Peptostreptococcaceae bacterium]